ncbi:DUF4252 domain-containing protein [Seongchinamella unica]|uniref:DUF4252 domain-containing protein n=1 Tax=Seongchinamella unica TaxID=2547392 RepID=A0A4R5LWX7_9GAMM|nr:DUF4252 domain-containing protein [Seongchinamella unica]TDG15937.1 DUF4252 domain-containing protein [Seongchinamella unica]
MKALITVLMAALFSLPVTAQEAQLESLPGYVDFADLDAIYGEPRVMINIGGNLLKLLSAATAVDDPETAVMISGLEGVRIKVYPTAGNLKPALEKVNEARASLAAAHWEPVVQVYEADEEVQIFMKSGGDTIEGLTVMAVNGEEAVFLNILGVIDPKQIGKVMNSLNVDVELDTE